MATGQKDGGATSVSCSCTSSCSNVDGDESDKYNCEKRFCWLFYQHEHE